MEGRFLFYGVPGTGKSTIAAMLAKNTGTKHLELDRVRRQAQQKVSRQFEPFLYEYSTGAWKHFGELSQETAVKGFLAVRTAMEKHVDAELFLQSGSYIAEAAFINPAHYVGKNYRLMLITLPDRDMHYAQFFVHRSKSDEAELQFRAARYIQDYLQNEAKALKIGVVINEDSANLTAE